VNEILVSKHVWGPVGGKVQTCGRCGMVRRWEKQPAHILNWYYYRNARARKSLPISNPDSDQWPHDYCHHTLERGEE